MEFLFLLAFATFVTIIMMLVISEKLSDNTKFKSRAAMEDFAQSIRNEIVTAATVSPGYKREIDLPAQYQRIDYTVSIIQSLDSSKSYLSVSYSYGTLSEDIPSLVIPHTSGAFQTGINVIENKNGTVCVNC